MARTPLTVRRWKRVEYDRLVALGAFDNDPIELIGGQLIVAEPKGTYHTASLGSAEYAVRATLPPGWMVRTQAPLWLDDESEPEPDLAVVPGRPTDYRDAHPVRPPLVIEVAETSLRFDRREKGSLYARAGIEEYWIVNIVDRVLEVYRDPGPDPAAVYGSRYRALTVFEPRDVVTPLAFPQSRIAVADLLP
ncbi:MAG TPA: Uma2 family endonuclease [Methylomirabilota bacterium]|jgi:Uma2 family endonuclease